MNDPDSGMHDLTHLLNRAADGDMEAKSELYQMIYDDLRAAARRVIHKKHRGDLQTTALVHESLLRFENKDVLRRFSENRRVFFSVAVRAMQQVLVNHYHQRRRESHHTTEPEDPFTSTISTIEKQTGYDFERLNMAINELREASPRQHAVVTHRFFGGLTVEQTAEYLNVSVGTVERDWRLAKARLIRLLGSGNS